MPCRAPSFGMTVGWNESSLCPLDDKRYENPKKVIRTASASVICLRGAMIATGKTARCFHSSSVGLLDNAMPFTLVVLRENCLVNIEQQRDCKPKLLCRTASHPRSHDF
jgi:hypothetical protein